MEYWLLDSETRRRIESGYQSGVDFGAGYQRQFDAYFDSASDRPGGRIYTAAGNTARIEIRGVMTSQPDFIAWLFGGGNTTYPEILDAIAMARQDEAVQNIELVVSSGGGQAIPMFDVVAALQLVDKPLTGIVEGCACSAAYGMISQCDRIIAANPAAMVGSVGAVSSMYIDPNEIDITSTNAPKKRPDPTTPEGVAAIREPLDDLHQLLVEAIATGRGTTVENINGTYGQGNSVIARRALDLGMIDEIASPRFTAIGGEDTTAAATLGGDNQPGDHRMDLKELKAQYPDVYAAARDEGVNDERQRCVAHLDLGATTGGMAIAVDAVKAGAGLDVTMQSKYMQANMAHQRGQNLAADDAEVGAVLTTDPATPSASVADQAWVLAFDHEGDE